MSSPVAWVDSVDSNRWSSLLTVRVDREIPRRSKRDERRHTFEQQSGSSVFSYHCHFGDDRGQCIEQIGQCIEPLVEHIGRLRKGNAGHGYLFASLDETHEHELHILFGAIEFAGLSDRR